LVFEPLESHFGPARQLIVSPDAALWLVPWGAFPLADGKYALEKYQIRYCVSGRDLVSHPSGKGREPNEPVLFADPDYDLAPAEVKTATEAVLRGTTTAEPVARTRGSGSLNRLPKVRRLHGTAQEAAAIKPSIQRYAWEEPVLYEDQYALEGVFNLNCAPRGNL
jgi:hypothetical protein